MRLCNVCNKRTCLVCLMKTLRCPWCRAIIIVGENAFVAFCLCTDQDDSDDSDSDFDFDEDMHTKNSCQFNFLLNELKRSQAELYTMKSIMDHVPTKRISVNKNTQTTNTTVANYCQTDEKIQKKYNEPTYKCECGTILTRMCVNRHLESISHKINMHRLAKKRNNR